MQNDLERLYFEIKEQIQKVDFSKLWKGFTPLKFALYNEKECFFDGAYVPKTDAFLGNTAISYNGEMIAIWNVMEEADVVLMASKMIHEMFHGFQQLNQESRFPNEIEALYVYKYDDANLSLKLEENRIIASLLDHFDQNEYQRFLQMKQYRNRNFNYEFHYESCIEQIEGTAEFVELCALKQLSYEKYQAKVALLKERITTPKNLIPTRINCYDVGALLLLLLNENGISYAEGFEEKCFGERLLEGVLLYATPIENTMGQVIEGYYAKARTIIEETIAKNDVVASGDYDLYGVNVYDAVYCDGYIISTYFVMYGEGEKTKVEYGDFLIRTEAVGKMTELYRIS